MNAPTARLDTRAFLAIAVTVPLCASRLGAEPPGSDDTLARSALVAYAANAHSFPHYSCRYLYSTALAKTVEDAIRGQFVNAVSYESRLLVDGDRDLYEGLAPYAPPTRKHGTPVPGKKGMFMAPALVSSDRYLSDGKREINFCPQLRSLGLWSKEAGDRGVDHSPLGMHFIGHRNRNGPDIHMARPHALEMLSDGLQEIDGRPAVVVRFKHKGGDVYQQKTSYVYSLDVSRGYLPVKMAIVEDGKPKSQVFVTDVRECSSQRWFPMRSVCVMSPGKPGSPFVVAEIKVLELDADHRPPAREFAIAVPAGTQVSDQQRPELKAFRLKQEEKLSVDDIPRLFAMVEEKQNAPLMDTGVHGRNRFPWLWTCAGIAVVLSGYLIVRRRRAKPVGGDSVA